MTAAHAPAYQVKMPFTPSPCGESTDRINTGFSLQIPPLLIPKEESYIPPENGGYVRPGSNLLPENSRYVVTGGYALQGYISNRTFKGRNSLFSGSALFM
jgi:hypothetical protein